MARRQRLTKEENWWGDGAEEWHEEQKWAIDWHSFRGKMWQDKMSHRKKKDKSRERCPSKLGNCPPWYLSHSNLISPNRLHYCCCSHMWLPPFPIAIFTLHTLVRRLQGDKYVLPTVCCVFTSIRPRIGGSQADAAPWVTCPASFSLHFCLPSLFPLIPLAHWKDKTEILTVNRRGRVYRTTSKYC